LLGECGAEVSLAADAEPAAMLAELVSAVALPAAPDCRPAALLPASDPLRELEAARSVGIGAGEASVGIATLVFMTAAPCSAERPLVLRAVPVASPTAIASRKLAASTTTPTPYRFTRDMVKVCNDFCESESRRFVTPGVAEQGDRGLVSSRTERVSAATLVRNVGIADRARGSPIIYSSWAAPSFRTLSPMRTREHLERELRHPPRPTRRRGVTHAPVAVAAACASAQKALSGRPAVILACLAVVCLIGATSAVPPAFASQEIEPVEYPVGPLYRIWLGELAAGSEGDIWYLLDSDYLSIHGVVIRISQHGVRTGEWWIEDREPSDIALGPEGDMWVSEVGVADQPGQMLRITPAGSTKTIAVSQLESTEFCLCDIVGSRAVAAGPDRSMWFTDTALDTSEKPFIGSIDESEQVVEHEIPLGSGLNEPVVSIPTGIAPGPDETMWFTDQGHNSAGDNLIGRVSSSGAITEFALPSGASRPTAIAEGSDGDMWFTEPGVDRIGRITPNGTITEFSASSVGGSLDNLVLAPDGDLWFGGDDRTVSWISPEGTVREAEPDFVDEGSALGLTLGPEHELWFDAASPVGGGPGEGFPSYLGHFAVPWPPSILTAPSVTGETQVGAALSADPGIWSNDPVLSYQWQDCNPVGTICSDLTGEDKPQHVVSLADVGHALRVLVIAANLAGEATAVSTSTPQIAAPTISPKPPAARLPLVGATATWKFGRAGRRTFVRSLEVIGLAPHDTVRIACAGGGCNAAHIPHAASHAVCHRDRCAESRTVRGGGQLNVAGMFAEMRLEAGAQITVAIAGPAAFGRVYSFIARRRGSPSLATGCLSPGSLTAMTEC
jgi:streptogramin lyase